MTTEEHLLSFSIVHITLLKVFFSYGLMAYQVYDDRSPAIAYSPAGWQLEGSSREYNGTTSSAFLANSTAKLTFRGITVAVYGTIGSKNANFSDPQSAYSIDNGPPHIFRPNQTDLPHYTAKFFQSGLLSNTEHTLVVTNLVNYGLLYLDYIVVVTTGEVPSSSVSPSVTISSTGSSSVIVASSSIASSSRVTPNPGDRISPTSVSVSTTTPQSSDSSSASGYSPTPNANVGATSSDGSHRISTIAGATVGAALAIILFLAICFFILRRQRKKEIPVASLWNPPSAYQISNPLVSRSSSTNVSSHPRSPSVVGNYPTSHCSIQDYSINRSLLDQPTLQAQLSPYSTLTPSRPRRDDFDEVHPPRYPSGEPPSYGQTHPRGLALVS